jgi:hypothetical protein
VGTTLQIVGETLCEALDLRAGSRVLDVAAGNGNATLRLPLPDPQHFVDVFRTYYGPMNKTFAALDATLPQAGGARA